MKKFKNKLGEDLPEFKGLTMIQLILVGFICVAIAIVIFGLMMGFELFAFIGFFNILNVHYDSLLTVFLFILAFNVISLLFELVSRPLYHLLADFIDNNIALFFLKLAICFPFNYFAIHLSDYLFIGINISDGVEVILTFLVIIVEHFLFDEDTKESKEV